MLKRAHNAAAIGDAVNNKIVEFANRGFRSLGVARADGDGSGETVWEMVGLIPMFDPPRVDTKITIEKCQEQVRRDTGGSDGLVHAVQASLDRHV